MMRRLLPEFGINIPEGLERALLMAVSANLVGLRYAPSELSRQARTIGSASSS